MNQQSTIKFGEDIYASIPGAIPDDDKQAQELFDTEWAKAVSVFKALTALDNPRFKLDLTNIAPHVAMADVYPLWRGTRCPWDRRASLIHLAFQLSSAGMTTWRKANLYVHSRKPDEALELLKGVGQPTRFDRMYAEHCGSFARAYLSLTSYTEALDWAKKAHEAAPDNIRLKVLYADALIMAEQYDLGQKIYSERLDAAEPEHTGDKVTDVFNTVIACDTGCVGSPVFAAMAADELPPDDATRMWDLVEVEYYDSPHVRLQHAYYLVKHGQQVRSFAKLLALAVEMPWVKEATINALNALQAIELPDSEYIRRLLQYNIDQNNWTTDDMHRFKV